MNSSRMKVEIFFLLLRKPCAQKTAFFVGLWELILALRDTTQVAKRGRGVAWVCHFYEFFFKKNVELLHGPGISKSSEQKNLKNCFLCDFKRNWLKEPHVKIQIPRESKRSKSLECSALPIFPWQTLKWATKTFGSQKFVFQKNDYQKSFPEKSSVQKRFFPKFVGAGRRNGNLVPEWSGSALRLQPLEKNFFEQKSFLWKIFWQPFFWTSFSGINARNSILT